MDKIISKMPYIVLGIVLVFTIFFIAFSNKEVRREMEQDEYYMVRGSLGRVYFYVLLMVVAICVIVFKVDNQPIWYILLIPVCATNIIEGLAQKIYVKGDEIIAKILFKAAVVYYPSDIESFEDYDGRGYTNLTIYFKDTSIPSLSLNNVINKDRFIDDLASWNIKRKNQANKEVRKEYV